MKGLSFLLLLLLAGCTSSKIVSSWTSPEAGRNDYKKILVVSLASNEDSTTRRQMEEHMVGDLNAIGYNAVSFLHTFNENDFKGLRYDSARTRFQREGIDGVVTISLLAKENKAVYVPDKPTPTDGIQRVDLWEYYTSMKQTVGKPGYYINSTELFWESNFYDVNTLALLYHVRSVSFDPASTQKMAHQYGKQVVGDLQKKYVLSAK
ncbi:MAG TPA: hypothetical protein VFL47_01435 [Flavisolibacter sp.]|nr:hypothetical protein [Flavisolibacter sp.]